MRLCDSHLTCLVSPEALFLMCGNTDRFRDDCPPFLDTPLDQTLSGASASLSCDFLKIRMTDQRRDGELRASQLSEQCLWTGSNRTASLVAMTGGVVPN